MKKILLLGANGYIGSKLFETLKATHSVEGVDINWFGSVHEIVVQDYNLLDSDYIKNFNVVIVLAGHSSVRMCDGPIQSSWKNNITNFINLLKKCNKNQLIIYASSGSIYSTDINSFVPTNNYDLTKYVLDIHILKLLSEYNIIGLRLGTVNGHSLILRNELMINSMVHSASQKNYVSINNVHINRPILGINDLMRAFETMIQNPTVGIYNLCSFNASVEYLGNAVSKILNVPLHYSKDTPKPYNFYFSNEEFQKQFDFKFTETPVTIIEDILNNAPIIIGNRNTYIEY